MISTKMPEDFIKGIKDAFGRPRQSSYDLNRIMSLIFWQKAPLNAKLKTKKIPIVIARGLMSD